MLKIIEVSSFANDESMEKSIFCKNLKIKKISYLIFNARVTFIK